MLKRDETGITKWFQACGRRLKPGIAVSDQLPDLANVAEEHAFIDGPALSEAVYHDYHQILRNPGSAGDAMAGLCEELLNYYGIQVMVMNTIDSASRPSIRWRSRLPTPAGPAVLVSLPSGTPFPTPSPLR